MARLLITKQGEPFGEFSLTQGLEYVAGRSETCDLHLEAERGISRQHLKIYYDGHHWTVEVLSRYGELYQGKNKVSKVHLKVGEKFEVPPYEFEFQEEVVAAPSDLSSKTNVGSNIEKYDQNSRHDLVDISEKTQVGSFELVPFLTVYDSENQVVQLFRLDGHSWLAGRDMTCTVFLENPKLSRRHFEICLQEGAYLIRDLGSINGTIVNGEKVPSQWIPLRSGDIITVVDWHIQFELKDPHFDMKLLEASHMSQPMDEMHALPPPHRQSQYENDSQYFDEAPLAKKTNFVRVLIGVILVGTIGYYIFGDSGKSSNGDLNEGQPKMASAINAFDKLPAAQQQYVRDSYRLADRLFKEGRYELARQEITKIHQVVPFFEESKNLEKLAEVAVQTQVEQQKADTREKEKIEMEDKIQKTVAACRANLNPNIEAKEIEDCLGPVVAFNPDHPAIVGLKAQTDQMVSDRAVKNARKSEYQAMLRKQKALFEKADSMEKSGNGLEAIKAFEAVVSSKLPDPEDLKGQAKRKIASIQQHLVSKQGELEKTADEAYKKGNIKEAVGLLNRALLINPENETLKGRVNSMLSELKKQMQSYYQEGVLEESVGEVETAKGKWKKIIEMSLPEEDYYKKAKSKLKKYGAE